MNIQWDSYNKMSLTFFILCTSIHTCTPFMLGLKESRSLADEVNVRSAKNEAEHTHEHRVISGYY